MPEPGEHGYEEPHEELLQDAESDLFKIGQLASLARTALDDPGAIEDEIEAMYDARLDPRENTHGALAIRYAIGRLDAIIAITDPEEDTCSSPSA